ncbi:MAG TPA: hypothetical protein VFI95_08710 [Terriglobales bacterium]|nr:hypothetical protein [Terriglobales bacterium]
MHATVTFPIDEAPPEEERAGTNKEHPSFHAPRVSASSSACANHAVRDLVQEVFSPALSRAVRRLLVTSLDTDTDAAEFCALMGRAMTVSLPGTVCLVEADPQQRLSYRLLGRGLKPEDPLPLVVSEHLWLNTACNFLSRSPLSREIPTLSVSSKAGEEFTYFVIHAPAEPSLNQTILLGQDSDATLLVLQAHRTRRAVAQRATEVLRRAKVNIRGIVLAGRTFPVPEALYRRL